MIRVFIIVVFLIFSFSGCSKKATVASYSDVNVPIKNLEFVHLNIEGSDQFIQKLNERIPIMFLEKEILIDDPSSANILHIIENPLQQDLDIEDYEETREVKYVRKIYNSATKEYETRITYIDRTYYTRCWIHTFKLSASVTTRYKRDTLFNEVLQKQCRTNRYNIFYRPIFLPDKSMIYNKLTTLLRDKIINYLVPYIVYYDITLEEELDIELSKKDKEKFELILEQIDKGLAIPEMIDTLESLNIKYPNSSTIHFTIGVLHEIFKAYDKALVNYQKANKIIPSKNLLKRIEKIKANQRNLEKIHSK